MSSFSVDLNCDMGESFGTYTIGHDEAVLPYVTSANIACGFHAGDAAVMKKTVRMALQHGVAIGAHPGFPDLQGFGRREIAVSPEEVYDMVVYQIGALWAFVQSEGGRLHHVKPHGALYNMAAVHPDFSAAVAEAVCKVDPELVLYGLSGSQLITAGRQAGLRVVNEVFADRTYQDDGTLTPRSIKNAVLTDGDKVIAQSLEMVREQRVVTVNGREISLKADTICIHGDGPHAAEFASKLHTSFKEYNIGLKAP